MQTYRESQQPLSVLLDQAKETGGVRIEREDGQSFVLRPETPSPSPKSPFDVPGIDLGITTAEWVAVIREGRERS